MSACNCMCMCVCVVYLFLCLFVCLCVCVLIIFVACFFFVATGHFFLLQVHRNHPPDDKTSSIESPLSEPICDIQENRPQFPNYAPIVSFCLNQLVASFTQNDRGDMKAGARLHHITLQTSITSDESLSGLLPYHSQLSDILIVERSAEHTKQDCCVSLNFESEPRLLVCFFSFFLSNFTLEWSVL